MEVIRLNQLKLRVNESEDRLVDLIKKEIKLKKDDKLTFNCVKKSLDARKKPDLYYVYSVNIQKIIRNGALLSLKKVMSAARCKNAEIIDVKDYEFPLDKTFNSENIDETKRPVIIGFGPAGLFCGLMLARANLRPVIYERGDCVEVRSEKVERMFNEGILDSESNVQFGEGGAGTFSDGKLNSAIKDSSGRIRHVLKTFVEKGAKEEILYSNKPHIGTDVLKDIVRNIREEIISLGGEVNFNSRFEGIERQENGLLTIMISQNGVRFSRDARYACLAIGHSARDTFRMLYSDAKLSMEAKAFAVGLRIQHNQDFINANAYGKDYKSNEALLKMPAADYKVTANVNGRGVYSFCMCPGGYVVNASSFAGKLCCNGMSYSGRDSSNANSAMIVTVTPKDFGDNALDGMKFQEELEEKAYQLCDGKMPLQLYGDFKEDKDSSSFGKVKPEVKGQISFGNLRRVLPDYISKSLIMGIEDIDKRLPGFADNDAILCGVESRTSSPLRILRDEHCESVDIEGLFLSGEGAGYAGGITSAAVDGIKVAENIYRKMLIEEC